MSEKEVKYNIEDYLKNDKELRKEIIANLLAENFKMRFLFRKLNESAIKLSDAIKELYKDFKEIDKELNQ